MSTDTALKADILTAAIKVARAKGYARMLRRDVARAAGCSPASVSWHYGSMTDLRIIIMYHAVERDMADIVAQGLGHNDPIARKAPEALKRRAARILLAA